MKAIVAAALALVIAFAPARAESERLQSLERLRGGPLEPVGGSLAGFIQLAFPSSLAARAGEVYIADTGLGWVLRYDRATRRYAKLVPAQGATQLAVGPDQSLYVMDPACQCVRRYSRSGQLLQQYEDRLNLVAPVDFALDEGRGLVWVLDGTYAQIVGFNPFGRVMRVLSLASAGFPQAAPVALARGSNSFYVADRAGRRVLVLDDQGHLVGLLGEGQLADPVAVVLDSYGRVLVADRLNQSVKRLWPEPVQDLTAGLRFRRLGDLAADENNLLVSDQLAGQVEVLRSPPPQTR